MVDIDTIFIKRNSSTAWAKHNQVSIPNRAMSFGDGLFETMIWTGESIRFFETHLERLKEGMDILGLESSAIIPLELIELLTTTCRDQTVRVRWNVYRSGVGKYTPSTNDVDQMIHISKFKLATSTKKLFGISDTIKLYPTAWSHCKTLNALPYILANKEREAKGWDEIILLDFNGNLSEAGSSNLFWIKDDIYFTPSLKCACVNGVARRIIIKKLLDEGKILVEGEFTPSELDAADQVFVSNVTGISYLQASSFAKYSTDYQDFLLQLFD